MSNPMQTDHRDSGCTQVLKRSLLKESSHEEM